MELLKTQAQDQKLLALNLFSRERMLVRVKTLQKEDFESSVISGSKTAVSSRTELIRIIKELIYRAMKSGCIVSGIEISHTHQNHKVDKNQWRIGEFSKVDIETAKYLKSIFSYPISMFIVSKFGISMRKKF